MMIRCPLTMHLNFNSSKMSGLMKKARVLIFSYCFWQKEISSWKPAISTSYRAYEVPPVIPMKMAESRCLIQRIWYRHWESHLGPFTFIGCCFFLICKYIPAHVFPKRDIHIILQYQKRKKFPVSVCCLPHQLSSPTSHVYCLLLPVCLHIRNRSTGYNINLLLLLIRMFSQRTMYMTLPVSITWTVPQITSSKAFHGSTW